MAETVHLSSWWRDLIPGQGEPSDKERPVEDGFAEFFGYDDTTTSVPTAASPAKSSAAAVSSPQVSNKVPVFNLMESEPADLPLLEEVEWSSPKTFFEGKRKQSNRKNRHRSISVGISNKLRSIGNSALKFMGEVSATLSASQEEQDDEYLGVVHPDGWTVFEGYSVHDEEDSWTVEKFDLQECKRFCLSSRYGGFVLRSDMVTIQTKSREVLLETRQLVEKPPRIGSLDASLPTLMVAPPEGSEQIIQSVWIEGMEDSLRQIKTVTEDKRLALRMAQAQGDSSAVDKITQELDRLKQQQSRLASALWHATGGSSEYGLPNLPKKTESSNQAVECIPSSPSQRRLQSAGLVSGSSQAAADLTFEKGAPPEIKSFQVDEIKVPSQGSLPAKCAPPEMVAELEAAVAARQERIEQLEAEEAAAASRRLEQLEAEEAAAASRQAQIAKLEAKLNAKIEERSPKAGTESQAFLENKAQEASIATEELKETRGNAPSKLSLSAKLVSPEMLADVSGGQSKIEEVPPAAAAASQAKTEEVAQAAATQSFKENPIVNMQAKTEEVSKAAVAPLEASSSRTLGPREGAKAATLGPGSQLHPSRPRPPARGQPTKDKAISSRAMSPRGKSDGKGLGKGKSKGKGPAFPMNGIGNAAGRRGKTPLGRRFHWKGLSAERVRGTIFDDSQGEQGGAPPLAFNMDALMSLFKVDEKDEDASASVGDTPRQSTSSSALVRCDIPELRIFRDSRAQHMSIVFKRVIGPTAGPEDMDKIARDLAAVELKANSTASLMQRDAEPLELLATALPDGEEAAALRAVPPGARLRIMPERMALPLAQVSRLPERLKALRLGAQAEALSRAITVRVEGLAAAGVSLRSSVALRQILRAVTQLGRWINAADASAEQGFALSSALGNLRQFKALRGDREISLLHVVVLSAGGDALETGKLGKRLGQELDGVGEAAREDIGQLAEAVAGFRAEAMWLEREADRIAEVGSETPTSFFYPQDVRERMMAIHNQQLVWRADALEAAWDSAQGELRSTLAFFAEPAVSRDFLPNTKNQSCRAEEEAFERLLRTVDDFRADMQRAAAEVAAQPQKFTKALLGRTAAVATSAGKRTAPVERRGTM